MALRYEARVGNRQRFMLPVTPAQSFIQGQEIALAVREALVHADLVAGYAVAGLVSSDLGVSYVASALVSSDLAASFAAEALVSSDLSISYASGEPGEVALSDITVTAGTASGPWALNAPSGYEAPFSVSGDYDPLPAGFSISGSNLVYDEAGTSTTGTTTHRINATESAPAVGAGSLYVLGAVTSDNRRAKIPLVASGVATSANIGATDFTIDFWLQTIAGNNQGAITPGANYNWINGNIVVDRDRFDQNQAFGISLGAGRVSFGVKNPGGATETWVGTTDVRDGDWHHIAVTRALSTGAVQVFVDGVREVNDGTGPTGSLQYPPGGVPQSGYEFSDPFLVLGAEKHDFNPASFPPFYGRIAGYRQSNNIRWSANFTPSLAIPEVDGNTVTLYKFAPPATSVLDSASPGTNGTVQTGASIVADKPYSDAESDWLARSQSAGVVYANRFDTLALYALNANSGPGYYNNGNNQQRGFRDTTGPRCSGIGSLRLEHRGADTLLNPTGKFSQENGPLFGAGFGQNSTFYVQFRIRFNANYLAGERQYWNSSGSKIIILHRNNATFAALELTTQHIPRSTGVGYPSMYTSGGTPQLTTQTTGPSAAANPPFLIQSRWNIDGGGEEPGYRWQYDDPPTNAFRWVADAWYTLDYRVQITTWGANTSRVEAWVTPAGSSQRMKFVSWRGSLDFNDSTSDTYNNLTLTGYCSNGSSSAPVDGSMWYDELIVSSQPIALPTALPEVP